MLNSFYTKEVFIMIGIALYPDKTTFKEDVAYLKRAQRYGYQKVFMSMLQIDIQDPKKSIRRLKESMAFANELGMLVMLDIHPMVFDYLKMKEDDLSYFHDIGVKILRLDSGYNGRTEAMMTHNPYGITIDVNMSNDTHYFNLIQDYLPQYQNLSASFNFYPQRYTGLSLETFQSCLRHFKNAHIQTAAFITSQTAQVTPWAISDGLCTLEDHRDLPIDIQARHMKMLKCVDDIIIGNAFASEEELKIVQKVMSTSVDYLHVTFNEDASEQEKQMVCTIHDYRGDASEYMIRSSHHKQKYAKESILAHQHIRNIQRGDILVLNDNYGQYKAEIQIALKDRAGDPRINVVGRIKEDEMLLLEQLKPFQTFELKEALL